MLREFQTCLYLHCTLWIGFWVGSLVGRQILTISYLNIEEIQILFTIKNLITFSDNLYRKHHLH